MWASSFGHLAEPLGELGVVLLRDTLELGDHQQRERLGVVVDDVAAARRDELLEQAPGQAAP